MKTVSMTIALLVFVTLSLCYTASAENTPTEVPTERQATPETAAAIDAAAYPLEICIVTGEKLGEMGEPVSRTYDGREVKFCCKMCIKGFEKDQAKWMKKLDDAIIEAQSAAYPLETCVVSGEKLGAMGEPVNYLYKNQLVKLCCKGCISTLEKDPQTYLKALAVPKTTD